LRGQELSEKDSNCSGNKNWQTALHQIEKKKKLLDHKENDYQLFVGERFLPAIHLTGD
jgi:hypothetical protein